MHATDVLGVGMVAFAIMAELVRRARSHQPRKIADVSPPLTVAYWKIRGLGAPLRMICHFAQLKEGADVEYVSYDAGNPSGHDYKSEWFRVKPVLLQNNPMMNLPYIIDRGRSITVVQTNACLYYLGRKFGLSGGSELERSRIDQIVAQTMDLRNASIGVFYGRSKVVPSDHASGPLRNHYAKLNDFMKGNDTLFSASDEITLADFHLWEMLDQHEAWFRFEKLPSLLPDFPCLARMYKSMKEDPRLKVYFGSQYHVDFELNNQHARFK